MRDRPSWWRPVLAGLLVALVIEAAGLAFVLSRPPEYRASATLVVLPDRSLDVDDAASYYDVLSRGQVVTTLAEILRVRGSREGGAASVVDVAPVPDTAVIQLSATAPTRGAAEGRVNDALTSVAAYFTEVAAPFKVLVVSDAGGSAEVVGASRTLAAAVGLVALLCGLGVGAAVRSLQRVREHSAVAADRRDPTTGELEESAPPPQRAGVPTPPR